jgi:hypothetical protein
VASFLANDMQLSNRYRTSMVLRILLCLVTASAWAGIEDCSLLWTRTWFAARFDAYGPDDRFSLREISQHGLHLTGQCTYFQLDGQSPRIAVIEGTDGKGCGFWPDVISQVKNEQTGKWETIAQPFNRGHRKSVEIRPGEFNQELFVALDVFLPFVGKQKLGRVALKGGEVATFELDKLVEDDPGVIESKKDSPKS